MANGIIIKAHQTFIGLVVQGKSFKDAYKAIAKKKPSASTCEVNGSKLAKKYSKEIQEGKDYDRSLVEKANKDKVVSDALKKILTQAEVDAVLCSIIAGSFVVEEIVVWEGNVSTYTRNVNASEVSRAIDLYNKRFGSNAPVKINMGGRTIKVISPQKRKALELKNGNNG